MWKLKPKTVKYCDNALYHSSFEGPVSLPATPLTPDVVIIGSEPAVGCDRIDIDASQSMGHGGRPFKFSWLGWEEVIVDMPPVNSTAEPNMTQLMLNLTNASSSPSLHFEEYGIGAPERSVVNYKFFVNVTNFMGVVANDTHAISVTNSPKAVVVI